MLITYVIIKFCSSIRVWISFLILVKLRYSTKPISIQILCNYFFFNLNIVGNNITLNTTISSPQLNPYWICHSLDTSIKTQHTNSTTPLPSCPKELSHRAHTINISTTPLPNTHYNEIVTDGCNSVIED